MLKHGILSHEGTYLEEPMGRIARERKPENLLKSEMLRIKTTETEKLAIDKRATELGLNTSEYIRRLTDAEIKTGVLGTAISQEKTLVGFLRQLLKLHKASEKDQSPT